MTPSDKLQHIYDKHAKEFGLNGPKNANHLQQLQAALDAHERSAETQRVQGWYRGQPVVLAYSAKKVS